MASADPAGGFVRVPPPNWYLRWRAERLHRLGVREDGRQDPPEALLQQVWMYQRLVQEKLRTSDGQRVRVLHPGFWNQEAGPDFRGAVIQVGSDPPVTGDIEIDVAPSGWEQHAHEANPAYQNVVLHVTWDQEAGGRPFPSVTLKHALDSTVAELAFWLGMQPKPAPQGLAGRCSAPLRALDPARVKAVLKQAAQARLRTKAEQLQARARQTGWDGALWEGLFGALGYKRNVWPMRRLGELRPALCAGLAGGNPAVHLQARLLGVAGLLPAASPLGPAGGPYLRELWQSWWRDSAQFRDEILPARLWNMAGLRPANHPQRRLALAAHWLARDSLPQELEHWLTRTIEGPDLADSMTRILEAGPDDFWGWHWTFRSARFKEPQPLLGRQRATDLAINVILPWLYVRACAGANDRLAAAAEDRYLLWPPSQDNSVLRLARQRLFGGVSGRFLQTAAEQQGVMQIVRDFCDQSNALCEQCLFPELVSAAVERV